MAKIDRYGSISKAAVSLNLSYSYVWKRLRNMEKVLGNPLIETQRGGMGGGGKADLTPLGRRVLLRYQQVSWKLDKLASKESSENF